MEKKFFTKELKNKIEFKKFDKLKDALKKYILSYQKNKN